MLPRVPAPQLTLTIASLVCAMSEMTPSVMMSSTEYWEPSCTSAAFLGWGAVCLGGSEHVSPPPHTHTGFLNTLVGTVLWLEGVS